MRFRQTLERLVWTFIQAGLAALAVSGLTSMSALQAAAVAGLSAVLAQLSIIARQRLAVLPDPGEGLPFLRVEHPAKRAAKK